jgi:hypothetical protein
MIDKPKFVAYGIGSICHAKDREHEFDASEKAVLEAGGTFLNPVKEEPIKTGMSCSDTEERLKTLWRTEQFEEYRKLMNSIWIKDLDNVRKADCLILHFEHNDSSVGAPLEMTMASLPYLLKLAKESCSEQEKTWLEVARVALKTVGFFHKPIYWVCTGAISDVNTTLKWLVLSGSDVRVFKTYASLTDFLKETYK